MSSSSVSSPVPTSLNLKRKRPGGRNPPKLLAVPIDELIEAATRNPAYGVANLLFFRGSTNPRVISQRNVTAANCCYATFDDVILPQPQLATECHTTGNVPSGERDGMINCYGLSREAVSILLDNRAIRALCEAVYGPNFCIADDRAHQRHRPRGVDLTDSGVKRLKANTHTDVPGPNGTFNDFFCPERDEECKTVTIEVGPNQVGVVLLSQSTPHSIGRGGCTSDGGPIFGYYLSPMAPGQHQLYLAATMAQFRAECTKVKSPRPGKALSASGRGEKCVYMWPELVRLEKNCHPLHLVAAAIAFSLRPILYPSRKIIKVPASYSPPYKHYTGYGPVPGSLDVDPADEIARLRQIVPGVVDYFQKVANDLPEMKWACKVSDLGREYLLRVFGLAADAEDKPLSRRYAALRALV